MRELIYSMGVSLDGFIAGPDGEIDWSVPEEELHPFHNEQTREIGAHFCGRRLYEAMLSWETVDRSPSAGEVEVEFARIWQSIPKVVFSRTLERVEGNARLAIDGIAVRQPDRPGWRHALLPAADERIGLELVETRTFGGEVVYLRYRRRAG